MGARTPSNERKVRMSAAKPHNRSCPATLLTLGGETLLVVGTANTNNVSLKLLSELGDVYLLAHPSLVEYASLVLVINLEALLSTRGRVAVRKIIIYYLVAHSRLSTTAVSLTHAKFNLLRGKKASEGMDGVSYVLRHCWRQFAEPQGWSVLEASQNHVPDPNVSAGLQDGHRDACCDLQMPTGASCHHIA